MDLEKWPVFSLVDEVTKSKIRLACVFGNCGNEVLFVTEDNNVYGMGPNVCGCLGVGVNQPLLQPKQLNALFEKNVVDIVCGSGPHVIALTAEGDVYSWGHNGYCELGNGGGSQGLLPTIVGGLLSEKKVVEVACGSNHNLALTSEGEVFAWGQNNSGQVGTGLTTNQSCPSSVTMGIGRKFVKTVACSQASSFAVLDTGEVYGWGYNGNGQLGIGNNANQLSPLKVSSLSGITVSKIACGHSHTLALSDEGHLYTWGSNGYGQLGTGNLTNVSLAVRVAKYIGRITDIAAIHYAHISAAVTLNLKIYMWGHCKGHSISEPFRTNLDSLHDVFAFFATPSVTWKPVRPIYRNGSSVSDTIRYAFDDPACSDLSIVVEDKPIAVHKCILRLRSEHFRTMFQHPWSENNTQVVNIDQFSYPVYRAFLQYLYTDVVCLSPEIALKLLELAYAYCEERLKGKCEEIIKHGITTENAAMFYSAAKDFQSKELEEFCFQFSLNHMTDVVQSEGFSKLSHATAKNFIRKASYEGAFKT